MKKIYFGGLGYTFFLFLLINNKKEDMIFVLPNFVDSTYPIILKNLKEYCDKVFVLPKKPSIKKIFSYFIYEINLKRILKSIPKDEIEIFGHSELGCCLLGKKSKISELEEGVANYLGNGVFLNNSLKNNIYFKIEKIIFYFIFKKKLLTYKEWLEKIDKFYATEKMPKDFRANFDIEKTHILELWGKKSQEEKKEILKIFNIKLEKLKKLGEKEIIVFTQPLSEDGYLSEIEKIELYRKILLKYPSKKIIIKSHPREKTRYEKIFKNCLTIKENYPSEIIKCLGFTPKKVVTIFSSAVLGFENNVEVDFYGTEINEKLFKRFGTQDNIMKRNAFL